MATAPVSVIIPSYNSARFIREAIDSVLAQTVVPAQIVVVDDGSTDSTEEVVAPYRGRVEYIRQANGGASAARNRGIKAASQPWVAFLDADDVWHPRKTELQLRILAERPHLDLLATGTFDWDGGTVPVDGIESTPPVREVSWEHLVVRTLILTSSAVVRRATLDRVGEFDTTLHGPEDRDLFLRVAEVAKVGITDAPLTGYRNVPGSLSKQAVTCEAGMRRILQRLDARGVWRGRPYLLRTRAYAYMNYTSALNFAVAGMYPGAVSRLVKSLVCYPLPYRRDEVPVRLGRLKSLAVQVLRLLHLKGPVVSPPPPPPRAPAAPGGHVLPGSPGTLCP